MGHPAFPLGLKPDLISCTDVALKGHSSTVAHGLLSVCSEGVPFPGRNRNWSKIDLYAGGLGQPLPVRFQIGDVMAEAGNSAADRQPRPDPNEKLVKVFGSEQEPEALVVKGLLDSAGIDSDLTSASLVQDAFPGLGGMVILVREEDADEARRVIAEGRQSAADDDERRRSRLLKSRHRRRDRVAVEVEGDGSVEISAVDAGSRVGETAENFDTRQAERIS